MERQVDKWLPSTPKQFNLSGDRLFEDYKPKPGGQTYLWDELLEFGNRDRTIDINPGYRGLYVRGGRGGGKSHIGAAIACSRAYNDPQSRGLISANEFGQLETSTLVALAEFCEQFKIPLEPCGETVEETARMIARRRLCQIFDAQVLVLAASKFGGTTEKVKQGGRGIQCRWAWLDEWATADRTAMGVLNAALGRGSGSLSGFFWITSTINLQTPYNWVYDLFDDGDRSDDKKELYKSVVLTSKDNDALGADFVRILEASYTPEMIAIELRGEYATSKDGRAFNHFDRTQHVKPCPYDELLPLHLSFDFNRNPATCAIAQVHNDTIKFIDEIYLVNSDTFALGEEARSRVDALGAYLIYIHGDASGRSLTANSQQSNWDIISNSMHGKPCNWQIPSVNPPIIDTLNTANSLLFHGRVQVDPKCAELIKDLEVCKLDSQGKLDKKGSLMRIHLCDCFRYGCHDIFPVTQAGDRSAIVGGKLKTVRW
jgi:Terminase large subunit, T4likevirus-type, N-terminal